MQLALSDFFKRLSEPGLKTERTKDAEKTTVLLY